MEFGGGQHILDSLTNAQGAHAVLSPEEAWSWTELYGMV